MTVWTAINEAQDGMEMLKLVLNALHNQLEMKHATTGYVKSYIELFTFVQGPNMSNDDYYAQSKGLIESI